MSYTPLEWKDGSQGGTPISAANLNRMEQGIKDAHDELDDATSAATANKIVRRDSSGRAKFADPEDNQDAATKGWVLANATQVGVAFGTIADTETLPLPDGFTEQQCSWIVSSNRHPAIGAGSSMGRDRLYCYVDEQRRVRVRSEEDGDPGRDVAGAANYLVIGVK